MVDIANTDYPDLPSDWQEENKITAETAVSEVEQAMANGQLLDHNLVELVSASLHELWVRRHADWAPEDLKKSYAELPEHEKEKDRLFARQAIAVCQMMPTATRV